MAHGYGYEKLRVVTARFNRGLTAVLKPCKALEIVAMATGVALLGAKVPGPPDPRAIFYSGPVQGLQSFPEKSLSLGLEPTTSFYSGAR